MNELIRATSPFDSIRRLRPDGIEYWSARELMPLLGYRNWQNFERAIEQAMVVAGSADVDVDANFIATNRVSGTRGPASKDYELSRYASYVTAMRGDSHKQEIADALTYFAVKTREAELAPRSVAAVSRRELAEMVIAEADRADRAEAKVIELHPKADAWDTLADTGADYSARDAAYILNRDPAIRTGQNRLLQLLREWRLIDRLDRPYANHAAHVTLRPQTRVGSGGERVQAKPQVRVTVQGLSYLHKRLGGVSPLDFTEVAS